MLEMSSFLLKFFGLWHNLKFLPCICIGIFLLNQKNKLIRLICPPSRIFKCHFNNLIHTNIFKFYASLKLRPARNAEVACKHSLWYCTGWGDKQMVNSPAEKVLGGAGGSGLDMTQQRALAAQKANCVLGYIQSSVDSTARKGMLPLCSAETPPALLWSPQHKKDMNQ